jgi:hypothetical protein
MKLKCYFQCTFDSIIFNIIFLVPMGRFQLELIYYFTYFSTVVLSNSCVFLPCRPFVVNTTFSTGPVSVEISSVSLHNSFLMHFNMKLLYH